MFPKTLERIESGMSLLMPSKYGREELTAMARRNMAIRHCHLIDTLFYRQRGVPEPLFTGMEYLKDALKLNGGVIVLVPHYGCLGSVVYGLLCRGYKVHQLLTLYPQNIYKKINRLDTAVVRAKARCWTLPDIGNIYYRPGWSMRQIYRVLQKKGILIMYADGSRGEKFEVFDFMGSRIRFSTGPAEIAIRTGAVLLPAFAITDEEGRHSVCIEAPIFAEGKDGTREATSAYLSILGKYVKEYPYQWHTWIRLAQLKDGIIGATIKEVELKEFYSEADIR